MCCELLTEKATKWDVVWDEPFCDEGWDRTHAHGNRQNHPFCRIHEDGSISPRATNADGEDEGEYEPGSGGRGLHMAESRLVVWGGGGEQYEWGAEEYGAEGYGAEELPAEEAYGAEGEEEWSEFFDDENQVWFEWYR